jgi:hypothetical protein
MDKLSLKERLKAEIVSFSGKMSLYADDCAPRRRVQVA